MRGGAQRLGGGAPEYKGRRITRYTEDDGQAIAGLEWTPDAKTLFFVRGGAANGRGEFPNPTSNPAGAEQAIWRVGLDGGEPVKVAAGSGIAVSPKGDGIAFTRQGHVFWAPLTGKGDPVEWVQTRGGCRQLRFSPDGSKLAFTSARGDHSFVGIYDLGTKTVRWLAPSVDEDRIPSGLRMARGWRSSVSRPPRR